MATDPSVFPQGLVSGPRLQLSTCEQVACLPASAEVTLPGTVQMHCHPYSQAHCRHSAHLPQELLSTKAFKIQLPQCDPHQLFTPLIPFPELLKFWSSYTGENMETVTDFIFLGSKITADSDCSHEIKGCLPLGRKAMANLDCILKSRNIILPTKVHIVKTMVFPVVMYGCESWTIRRLSAEELMLLNCGVGDDS